MSNVNKPAWNNCSARVFLFSMSSSPMIQNKGNAAKQIAAFPFQPSDHPAISQASFALVLRPEIASAMFVTISPTITNAEHKKAR